MKARVVDREIERVLPAQVEAQRIHRALVGEALAVGEQHYLREQARRDRGAPARLRVALGEVLVGDDPLAVLGEQGVDRLLRDERPADARVEEALLRPIHYLQHPATSPKQPDLQEETYGSGRMEAKDFFSGLAP